MNSCDLWHALNLISCDWVWRIKALSDKNNPITRFNASALKETQERITYASIETYANPNEVENRTNDANFSVFYLINCVVCA